jgi:hypothetical protein
MRTSRFPLSTLKEIPSDAEIVSHRLMLRTGLIRKLAADLYAWLPLGLAALLALTAGSVLAQPVSIPYTYSHGIQPRLQWEGNYGYCGETSFISAGLHFGQYSSQYTARALASPGVPQNTEASQLLLGINDTVAARRMRLQASEFYWPTQRNTRAFTDWVKSHTLRGRVVIIGVFNNGILLDEWSGRDDGDAEYDHIVPVLGWGSDKPLSKTRDTALPNDVITFSDNGLYGPFGDPPTYPFLYSFRLRHFTGTRRQANNPNGPLYLLSNKAPNFAIAIEGPLDLDGVTVPVRLAASTNQEPPITDGSNEPPVPGPLTLTATVEITDTSSAYNLYLYDDFDRVPVANFNAMAASAAQSWHIPPNSGNTYSVSLRTSTGATAVFRAVPQSAP